jgi:excisionase family DNA binding protein
VTTPQEVIVNSPAYWTDRVPQLALLLRSAAERHSSGPIGDPTGIAPNPDTILTVADPAYWASQVAELQDVLSEAGGRVPVGDPRPQRAAGVAATNQERLTLTVEEAAAALGISRAFAYESVHWGDIPSIKIGRRILVPRAALFKLVSSSES